MKSLDAQQWDARMGCLERYSPQLKSPANPGAPMDIYIKKAQKSQRLNSAEAEIQHCIFDTKNNKNGWPLQTLLNERFPGAPGLAESTESQKF